MGLSYPLADAGTLLRYAMGESACSVVGPRPQLVGRGVPMSVLDSAERGACPDVRLSVGAPPSLRGTITEVVLAPSGVYPAAARGWAPVGAPGGRGATLPPRGCAGLRPHGGGASRGRAGRGQSLRAPSR